MGACRSQRVRPEVAGPMTGSARAGIHNHRSRRYFTGRDYGFRARRCAAPRNDNLFPFEAYLDRGSIFQRLIDDAITFGEFQKLIELVLRRVGVDVEAQADLREADRRFLGDAKRAAKIEIAFGGDRAGFERNIDRGRDRFERDAGAGDQSFQTHVARAQFEAGAGGGGSQAGDRKRAAGLNLAGDVGVVERTFGFERDQAGLRIGLVAFLGRRLHRAQPGGVHCESFQYNIAAEYRDDGGRMTEDGWLNLKSVVCRLSSVVRYHHNAAPVVALGSASAAVAARLSERSSAASTRRLTKSKAAD